MIESLSGTSKREYLFHYGRSRDLDFSHECIPDFSTGRLKLSTGVFLFARFSNLSKARNRDSREAGATHKGH